ncbi:MAG: 3-hydroxyisobutyryl-CoA hydrolase [Coxiella sp. (in: Bacteria)]|nr:MAG: 3-hydroxyisobutyryl-CoA hydrolase [Coxiella sp. (in: g-proteobacteria)]
MPSEVTFEIVQNDHATLGHITLNRPKALNALSIDMLTTLTELLTTCEQDPAITAVIIEGAGDRAFCAGGDIRWVYHHRDQIISGDAPYFEYEYHLNELLYNFSKPYIALLDGITMGGGIGISLWGSHPIATERLLFAMPETGIGLFPDIGASYFLTRLPHRFGWYLGLTGNSINAYEALTLGLVKTVIPHDTLNTFKTELNPHNIILPTPMALATASDLLDHQADIEHCFNQPSVSHIISSLMQKDDWCQSIAATLKTRSPLSLKITFDYLNTSIGMSFSDVMVLNKEIVVRFLENSDFFEGVRAVMIDKDKNPQWQHRIEDVDQIGN